MAPLPARHRLLRGPALLLAFLLALISHVAARQPSLSPAGSAAAAARRRLQQVTGGGVAVGPRCPQLSKQLLMGCARDNLIMFAVVSRFCSPGQHSSETAALKPAMRAARSFAARLCALPPAPTRPRARSAALPPCS